MKHEVYGVEQCAKSKHLARPSMRGREKNIREGGEKKEKEGGDSYEADGMLVAELHSCVAAGLCIPPCVVGMPSTTAMGEAAIKKKIRKR